MTAIFIAFDQSYYQRIIDTLQRLNCRGFTAWEQVQGRGSHTGEPHYGTHAWPSMAGAIMTIVDPDERAETVLQALRAMDEATPRLGLRAFTWPVTASI